VTILAVLRRQRCHNRFRLFSLPWMSFPRLLFADSAPCTSGISRKLARVSKSWSEDPLPSRFTSGYFPEWTLRRNRIGVIRRSAQILAVLYRVLFGKAEFVQLLRGFLKMSQKSFYFLALRPNKNPCARRAVMNPQSVHCYF
jgi:hypothetical protein